MFRPYICEPSSGLDSTYRSAIHDVWGVFVTLLYGMGQFVFRHQSEGPGWARGLYRRRNVKVCVPGMLRVTFDSLT